MLAMRMASSSGRGAAFGDRARHRPSVARAMSPAPVTLLGEGDEDGVEFELPAKSLAGENGVLRRVDLPFGRQLGFDAVGFHQRSAAVAAEIGTAGGIDDDWDSARIGRADDGFQKPRSADAIGVVRDEEGVERE
jgi:hypothetical protein